VCIVHRLGQPKQVPAEGEWDAENGLPVPLHSSDGCNRLSKLSGEGFGACPAEIRADDLQVYFKTDTVNGYWAASLRSQENRGLRVLSCQYPSIAAW
jgi:hypothetical protein